MTFRRNGASTVSLIMLAQGQLDGYIALGVSSWDVLAGLAVAEELGYACSIDWTETRLADKLCLACAPAPLLERLAPFLRTLATG